MTKTHHTKFIQEGQYAAAVDVELIESDTGWSPALSVEDAQKLDEVREALRKGDLKKAGHLARVYQLPPWPCEANRPKTTRYELPSHCLSSRVRRGISL